MSRFASLAAAHPRSDEELLPASPHCDSTATTGRRRCSSALGHRRFDCPRAGVAAANEPARRSTISSVRRTSCSAVGPHAFRPTHGSPPARSRWIRGRSSRDRCGDLVNEAEQRVRACLEWCERDRLLVSRAPGAGAGRYHARPPAPADVSATVWDPSSSSRPISYCARPLPARGEACRVASGAKRFRMTI